MTDLRLVREPTFAEQVAEQVAAWERSQAQSSSAESGLLSVSAPHPEDIAAIDALGRSVVSTLGRHGALVECRRTVAGPTLVRFDLALGPRTKVSHVRTLVRDVAAALGAEVRLVDHLRGESGLAIEVPHPRRRPVRLGDVLRGDQGPGALRVAIGLDAEGAPVVVDLATLPHLLIGGTTGSGKTTLLHSIICSLLVRNTPRDVRLLLIDPKRVELARYCGFPHLLVDPVREVTAALEALSIMVSEVDSRYAQMEKLGCTSIAQVQATGKRWPYVVVVIDELADLMMTASTRVEQAVVRIAQKARAVGVHLVLATQTPRVEVVTGILKANLPARIALTVPSFRNSGIIIDQSGAQNLLGKGDLLMVTPESGVPLRAQAPVVPAADFTALRARWGVG